MQSAYSTFSTCLHGPVPAVQHLVLQRTARTFLSASRASAPSLFADAPGMESVLVEWIESSRSSFWVPPLGRIHHALRIANSEHLRRAWLQAALLATIQNDAGTAPWRFRLYSPIHLCIEGIGVADVVAGEASATGNDATFVFSDAKQHTCSISLSRSSDANAFDLARTARVDLARPSERGAYSGRHCPDRIFIVPSALVDPAIVPEGAGASFVPSHRYPQSRLNLQGALALIARTSPEIEAWVASVIRWVTPLAAPPNQLSSSSSPWDCGVVALTDEARAIPVAEMLVHEASHQHFFMAKLLGDIHDGSDASTHYSPMARAHRPLERLLLAYHALGNMAILYDALIAHAVEPRHCMERLSEIATQMRDMNAVFETSRSLTELGRAIHRPLFEVWCDITDRRRVADRHDRPSLHDARPKPQFNEESAL